MAPVIGREIQFIFQMGSDYISKNWENLSNKIHDFYRSYYLPSLLEKPNQQNDPAHAYSKNLLKASVYQCTFPNKKEIWKNWEIREHTAHILSSDGKQIRVPITVFTSRQYKDINDPEKTHTILRFSGNKEDKITSNIQAMSLISEHVDFIKNSHPSSHYNLKLLQVDFYSFQIKNERDDNFQQWKPTNSEDFGVLGKIIETLHNRGYKVQFFYFYSVGTMVFNGLERSVAKYFSNATIIVDRGFTSSNNAAWQLMPWYKASVAIVGSYLMNWRADINYAMVKVCSNLGSFNGMRIIILENQNDPDHFTFNPDLEDRLSPYTMLVDRITMIAEPIQVKEEKEEIEKFFGSQASTNSHAFPLSRFHAARSYETIDISKGENILQWLIRDVFSQRAMIRYSG
ncbi:MAG: hypothetical protein WAM28_04550 [Chlamydiales bacterium]